MRLPRRLAFLWRAGSDIDTALSWRERIVEWGVVGLVLKLGAGLISGAVTLLIGLATGYDWPVVLLAAFLVVVAGVFMVDRLMSVRTQRALRQFIQTGQLTSSHVAQAPPRTPASQEDLRAAVIREHAVWLVDLVRDRPDIPPIISHRTFEDCDIHGPALVYAIGPTRWEHCNVLGDADSFFIPIEAGRSVIGVIGLEHCVFRRCRIISVGVLAPPDHIQELKASFT